MSLEIGRCKVKMLQDSVSAWVCSLLLRLCLMTVSLGEGGMWKNRGSSLVSSARL